MSNFGLIELGLVFGAALAAALWELYTLRKSMKAPKNERHDHDRRPES
jgi:hypothetical protein